MAPAVTDTNKAAPNGTKYQAQGQYKNPAGVGPNYFDKHAEENGIGEFGPAKYPHYLPTWNYDEKYPPLEPFEHYEHAKDADASFATLLHGAKVTDITPILGAEVHGIQLSKLSDKGKDELALFVAQKKVVAFREQDFADLPIQEALDFAGYFGRHHIHPTAGVPKGYPEILINHRGAADTTVSDYFTGRMNSVSWHSDSSFEAQPPGTTFLSILDGPSVGGDTLFANTAEAYRRLSPAFQKRLHGLKAMHSAHQQAARSYANNGVVRRDPVANAHPLVRTHPATGEKAIFANGQFTLNIIGYKQEESDNLLKFLFDQLAQAQDLQCRVKWAPGTVVVWDNRVTAHSAVLDWHDGQRRHLARITPQAERPFETPFDEDNSSNGTL